MKSAVQKKGKRVMVFGVFDRLHPGHLSFLKQARKHGENLIVVVARDSAVFKLKNKKPRESEAMRLQKIRRVNLAAKVVLGDRKQGEYTAIKKYRPDLIGLGYDQKLLAEDLKKRMYSGLLPRINLLRLKPYYPRKYHTSKIKMKI